MANLQVEKVDLSVRIMMLIASPVVDQVEENARITDVVELRQKVG